jgi:hypothetical protein
VVLYVRFQVLTAASIKFGVVFVVITLMMETVRTSEISVNFNVTTRHYIPEGSKLYGLVVMLGGVVVSVLAFGPMIEGFKPDRGR